MTSRYHTIQFVLHIAKIYQGDWDVFMRKVSKMFNNDIPISLLKGLERECGDKLKTACNRYMTENIQKLKRLTLDEKAHTEKVCKWQERVNRGNLIAFQKQLEVNKQLREHNEKIIQSQKEMERKMVHDYIQKKQLEWDKEMQDIKDKRNKELDLILLR